MNLLFFDIECASVYKTSAKICAFGYVLCDENFNILEKEDILINPRGKFHPTDRKGDKGIVLPYEYGEFKKYPPFKQAYPKIKALLENPENIVLGHATLNDVKYLNLETQRFKLPSFSFRFSDSQLIYMTYINDYSRQFGLEHIAEALGVEFTPHRAVDDAYATMKVVEAMCRESTLSYSQLIEKLQVTSGRIVNYAVTKPTSRGFKKHAAEVNAQKCERAQIRAVFFDYVNRKKVKKGGKAAGKVFTFSRAIEDDLSVSKKLVDYIYANGGTYSRHVSHSNYYISENGDESPRTKAAKSREGLILTDIAGLKELFND